MSSWMARQAACLMASGAGKSGKPCERLTAWWRCASRVISRMTDSVNCAALTEPRAFRTRGFGSIRGILPQTLPPTWPARGLETDDAGEVDPVQLQFACVLLGDVARIERAVAELSGEVPGEVVRAVDVE